MGGDATIMSDERSPDPFEDLDARLRKARSAGTSSEKAETGLGRVSMSGFGVAFRIGVEMVAALVVGVGFGLLLDNWLETAPLFLIVFFFLGAAAGGLNVYRAANRLVGGDAETRREEWPRNKDAGEPPARS